MNPYPGDGEYCDADWPYSYPYDATAEYYRGKAEIYGPATTTARPR